MATKKTTKTTKATTSKKTKHVPLATQIIKDAASRMTNQSKRILTADQMDDIYDVRYVVPTGLPSLDLILAWRINSDGTRDWGLPAGRFNELVGANSSGKTLIAHNALARAVASGGLGMKFMSERDHDSQWISRLIEEQGIEDPEEIEMCRQQLGGGDIESPGQLRALYSNLVKSMNNYYPDDGSAPLTVVVVDSVAELMGDDDLLAKREAVAVNSSRVQSVIGGHGEIKGDGNRPGNHAKHLQEFFKMASHSVHTMNVLFLFVNQERANIQTGYSKGGSKTKAAHEASMKYINSFRIKMNRYGAFSQTTINSKVVTNGWKVGARVLKRRNYSPMHEDVTLVMRPNSRFDVLYSLIESFIICGLAYLTCASSDPDKGRWLKKGAKFNFNKCMGEYPLKHDVKDADGNVVQGLDSFLQKYHGMMLPELRTALLEDMNEDEELFSKLMDTVKYLGPLYLDTSTKTPYNETKYYGKR